MLKRLISRVLVLGGMAHVSLAGASGSLSEPQSAPAEARKASPDEPPPARRIIHLGFAGAPFLQRAVMEALRRDGSYEVRIAPRIPEAPFALFVSGTIDKARAEDWVDCRARYFVASQPGPTVDRVETAAASAPLLTVIIFKDAPERVKLAEEACVQAVGVQVAEQLVAFLRTDIDG